MTKLLKLLSFSSLSIPLVLISCSQSAPIEETKIEINRELLQQNFETDPVSGAFNNASIEAFKDDFNMNPQNYFITSSESSIPGVTPFIRADLNAFLDANNEDITTKPIISSVINPPINSSFITIKFSFELRSNYNHEIIISDSPELTLDTKAFSMDFRILLPSIADSAKRKEEIDWIKTFFSSSNIDFIDWEIKNTTLAKTAAEVISEITNKNEFEKIFKMTASFPNSIVTGWEYEVKAIPDIESETSIKLQFTLSNNLFQGSDALTAEEMMIEDLTFSGFAKVE